MQTQVPPMIMIQLPGYECQLNQDGVTHSTQKLESTLRDLLMMEVVPVVAKDDYGSSTRTKNDNDEQEQLMNSELVPLQCAKSIIPCRTHEETINYRSSCTFQILKHDISQHECHLQYAMRCCKQAVPLQADYFPVATPRIQKAMNNVMELLNLVNKCADNHKTSGTVSFCGYKYERLRKYLSSVSFVSSWNDDLDCVVTFNYCEPIYYSTDATTNNCNDHENCNGSFFQGDASNKSRSQLLSQATEFFVDCHDSISCLILRSKNLKETIGKKNDNEVYMEDVLYMRNKKSSLDHGDVIEVCLEVDGCAGAGASAGASADKGNFLPIYYSKPINAFSHPNRNTMLQALNWIMNKLKDIGSLWRKGGSGGGGGDGCDITKKNLYMLEMYCGCGAHTMAVAKSNIFDSIVAIELDQRLVDACIVNCRRNGCCPSLMTIEQEGSQDARHYGVTPVHVFQGNASEWAKKSTSFWKQTQKETRAANYCNDTVSNKTSKSFWYNQYYHVLLVDPPRMGLGEDVIQLAIHGSFEHIIYVSCGRKALIRDLMLLREAFDVVDLVITDLFPRTDSVETILHLQRRSRKMNTTM
jgi:SAM-dependent methyltransferases related to tRNA (uracil-5-)-methyltransferase